MGARQVKKPAKGTTPPEKPSKQENLKHTLFCVYFTRYGTDTFNNATLSYAEAYEFDLDTLSTEVPKTRKGQKPKKSEYDNAYFTCAVSGKRLLKKDNILKQINKKFVELFGSENDLNARLAKIAYQEDDHSASLVAIRDINKLKRRLNPKEDPDDPNAETAQPITRIEIVVPPGTQVITS